MMNTMDPNKAYNDVEKMMYKLAWKWHRLYHIPFEECLSECHYACVKAINWRWDPNKGTKFSTTVHNIAQFRLRTLVIERTNAIPHVELTEEHDREAPPMRSECLEIIEDLSKDAQEIVQLIVDTPAEILGLAPVPVKQLVSRIKQHLVRKGRNAKKVEEAHRELICRFRAEWSRA